MINSSINNYQRNAIMTASPAELTLMLYDGAVKFCNIAATAIENKDVQKAHDNIKKVEAIITELRTTLDRKYPVYEDFERVYAYIYGLLLEANFKKDKEILERALSNIRDMRDVWKEVMRLNKAGGK